MSDAYSPQAAAEQARDAFRKSRQGIREAEARYHRARERARSRREDREPEPRGLRARQGALEEAIDALERSFDAAGQGATAFNRKLIDLAQRNLNSGFDLAKKLAGAKKLGEILELQSAFIRSQFDVFANQAGEIRALTTKIAADTTEPIKLR